MTSRTQYPDCFKIFDEAVASPWGIRVRCADFGTAMHLRTRLNRSRALARNDSKEHSYDHLIAKVREADKAWWVYVEKIEALDIQPLSNLIEKPAPKSFEQAEFKRRI